MNKLTKVFLGAGAFLIMSGGLLALSGWAMGGQTQIDTSWGRVGPGVFFSSGVSGRAVESREGYLEDLSLAPFDSLDVDVDMGDVTVVTGADYGVSLNWRGHNYTMSYELDGDTLEVRGAGHGVNLNLGDLNNYGGAVVIYVPEGVRLERAEFALGMGDLSVAEVQVRTLSVDSDMGSVDLTGVWAERMDLQENMGDITGTGLEVTRELTADNDMGDIYLEGDLRGTLDIDDNMGGVDLFLSGAEREYSYELGVGMGSIYVNGEERRGSVSHSGGENTLEADNDMGDITLNFGS